MSFRFTAGWVWVVLLGACRSGPYQEESSSVSIEELIRSAKRRGARVRVVGPSLEAPWSAGAAAYWEWAAGLADGDGYRELSVRRSSDEALHLSIDQTHAEVPLDLVHLFVPASWERRFEGTDDLPEPLRGVGLQDDELPTTVREFVLRPGDELHVRAETFRVQMGPDASAGTEPRTVLYLSDAPFLGGKPKRLPTPRRADFTM